MLTGDILVDRLTAHAVFILYDDTHTHTNTHYKCVCVCVYIGDLVFMSYTIRVHVYYQSHALCVDTYYTFTPIACLTRVSFSNLLFHMTSCNRINNFEREIYITIN